MRILQPSSPTPVITTSVTVPLVIGGTTASSTLSLQSTSGVGTTDAIIFKVGNNGATEGMRINTSGFVGFGTSTPAASINVVNTTTAAVRGILNEQYNSSTQAARSYYRKARGTYATPLIVANGDQLSNLIFAGYDGSAFNITSAIQAVVSGTVAATRVPSKLQFFVSTDALPSVLTEVLTLNSSLSAAFVDSVTMAGLTITPIVATGTVASALTITEVAHTALTASTERFDTNFNSARTVQWATGALTTQRFNLFQAPTVGFVGASALTDVATLAITGAPIQGTNATVTSSHGLLVQAGAVTGAVIAKGITAYSPTGGTANVAGHFLTTGSGTAGALTSPTSVGNVLVVESAGSNGMSILAPNASSGFLVFGCPSDNRAADISYTHSTTTMQMGTSTANGITKMTSAINIVGLWMDANQNVMVGPSAVTPISHALALSGQAARSFGVDRHLTSNTAGNNLTVQSGGATLLATDKAPGDLILATGLGTGNAPTGIARLKRGGAVIGTGTGDQTLVDSVIVDAMKTLTDGSPIDVLNITCANNTATSVVIEYSIEATDLTDYQVETGHCLVSVVNKAGAVTRTITEINSQQAVSSGATLATTWAVTAANPAVVSINANTSLTVGSGFVRTTFTVNNHGHQAIALV